jgi:ABC-type sugar transport system permease subunit
MAMKFAKNKEKKGLSKNAKKYIFVYSMLSIAIVNFIVFWLYVNLNSILLAFKQTNASGTVFTLDNFNMLFREFGRDTSELPMALRNTLIFFSVNLFIILPLSLFFAYYLYKKIIGYRLYKFIFFLPMIFSSVVLVSIYKGILGPNGPVSILYEFLFHVKAPFFLVDSRYALQSIIIYCIWTGFGLNMVLFSGAMLRIPESVIEYSKIDGVGQFREIFQIVIPLIWPTISTLLLVSIVGIFTASGPILLFSEGKYQTNTISFWIFWQVTQYKSYEYSSAVGLFFTAIAFPIVMTVKYILNKIGNDAEW